MTAAPRYRRAMTETHKPRITITYCTGCNWLLRAGWMAQELLQTFGQDLSEVALILSGGEQPGVPFFDNSGTRPTFRRL